MIRRAVAALVIVGCSSSPPPAAPDPAPAPRDATLASPDVTAHPRCDAYGALLAGWQHGPLPGGADEARLRAAAWDRVEPEARLVPIEDEARARTARYLDANDGAATGAGLSGPRAYVRLRDDLPTAAVEALLRAAPVDVEVRALVAKSRARRVEEFAAAFPLAPVTIRARLGTISGFGDAAPILIELAGGCGAALRALEPAQRGLDARVLGPAMADAIRGCGCRLADLDGFVALFAWLVLPRPELGWLPIADVVPATTSRAP